MILPSKHLSASHALIGLGALLIQRLEAPQTVTSLWEQVRMNSEIGRFERFVLALDLLHIVGAIKLSDGMIERVAK